MSSGEDSSDYFHYYFEEHGSSSSIGFFSDYDYGYVSAIENSDIEFFRLPFPVEDSDSDSDSDSRFDFDFDLDSLTSPSLLPIINTNITSQSKLSFFDVTTFPYSTSQNSEEEEAKILKEIPDVDKSESQLGEKVEKCSICRSDYQSDESLIKLEECAHIFHVDCVMEWVVKRRDCPLCRNAIKIKT